MLGLNWKRRMITGKSSAEITTQRVSEVMEKQSIIGDLRRNLEDRHRSIVWGILWAHKGFVSMYSRLEDYIVRGVNKGNSFYVKDVV